MKCPLKQIVPEKIIRDKEGPIVDKTTTVDFGNCDKSDCMPFMGSACTYAKMFGGTDK